MAHAQHDLTWTLVAQDTRRCRFTVSRARSVSIQNTSKATSLSDTNPLMPQLAPAARLSFLPPSTASSQSVSSPT
jgi:hypothetical protein